MRIAHKTVCLPHFTYLKNGPGEITMKTLPPPDYSDEERQKLITYLIALRKPLIQEFFDKVELPRSGTKQSLRKRIEDALSEGALDYVQIVDFLDLVTPWGKQHVFLYHGPNAIVGNWKDPQPRPPFHPPNKTQTNLV